MKTRLSVANLCYSFVPKYYDSKLGKFVDNPHGKNNSALYIGTEMELIEEVEPILWSYIADVPEDHILFGSYDDGEEERVNEAIKILQEEGHIYLEYVPDYDIHTLENVIEQHVLQHGVKHVFFDYIMITTDLISEFQSQAKAHMNIREDQVLSNVSTKLKELTRKYNISIDTWTQVSGDWKDERNRDQTIVRGSRAIIDKADLAAIVTRITLKEKILLKPILEKASMMFGKPDPNICISVYKNRGGKYNNVKIWLYIDYSTMRVDDLFVTDNDYQILEIAKTYTGIIEDGSIIIANSREELTQMLKEREMAQDILDDGSSNALEELGESLELEEDNNESINHFVELEEPEDEKVPEEEEKTDSEEENIETLSTENSEDESDDEEIEEEIEEDEYEEPIDEPIEDESELVGFDDIPEIEDEGDSIPEIEEDDSTSIEDESDTLEEDNEPIKQTPKITPKKEEPFGDGWDDDW